MCRISLTRSVVWTAALSSILATRHMARAEAPNAPDRMVQVSGLDVAVWLPSSGSGPHPFVLFSHGFGGCKTQSSYLMRALAQRGILVAAPDHKDNQCGGWAPPGNAAAELSRPRQLVSILL
jgi:predicted dienelactone hydrolase